MDKAVMTTGCKINTLPKNKEEPSCGCGCEMDFPIVEHSHHEEESCGCGCDSEMTFPTVEHTHHEEEGCGCGCDSEQSFPIKATARISGFDEETKKMTIRVVVSVILSAIGFALGEESPIAIGLILLAYLVVGSDVVITAFKSIKKGKWFSEHLLMSIATIGAILIGEYLEAVAVMAFYQVGEIFQSRAVNKSKESIAKLMDITPQRANLLGADGSIQVVHPKSLKLGDKVLIKTGEKIPVDGAIIEGHSEINTSALTGESLPVQVAVGDELLSGSINIGGMITMEVTTIYQDSTVAKILALVEQAGAHKAKSQRFISKFASYYTPIVVVLALMLAIIPSIITGEYSLWIYRALAFLVTSCPCGLVISIPLSFFGGIGGASSKGILMKGGSAIEALAKVDHVVMDKTGTITKGVFSVVEVQPVDVSENRLVSLALSAQRTSTHPIAKALEAYEGAVPVELISAQDVAGKGIVAQIAQGQLIVGSSNLMADYGITAEDTLQGSLVHVALQGRYLGVISLQDTIKSDSFTAVEKLKKNHGVVCHMVTGDNGKVAQQVANEIGITDVYYKQLPQDKMARLQEIKSKSKGTVAFVGDGINDAPVLTMADVGIAMGGIGSSAAVEASDVVLVSDELSRINTAISISKKTMTIVAQNIFLSLGIKVLVMALVALGYSNMWMAIFADVGVTILSVLNAIRALQVKD